MSETESHRADPIGRTIIERQHLKTMSQLNRGGMADLYDAFDREGNRVVFRQLRPSLKLRLKLRRCFKQGIGIRRQLGRHRAIVQYLGEGGLLVPYEVIEYIPGSSLKTLIFNRDASVRQHPVCILEQIADALAHLHRQGWLHLDVKPENIMVINDGKRPLAKLTDFDLCQPIGRQRAPKDFGGSLAYLPPEYLNEKAISIGTDVFAFGVLAYNLFTSQMPFVGSVQANMHKGTYEVKFPTTQDGKVPEVVAEFIRRCLAPQVIHRFCDDQELANGLKVLKRKLSDQLGRPVD